MKLIYFSYNGFIKIIGYIIVEKWYFNNSKFLVLYCKIYILILLYFYDIDSLYENEYVVIIFEMFFVLVFDLDCV